jgi:predicted nucleic acid-binding protein
MFWDSSAVVPLLVAEASSSAAAAILLEDKEMTMWWATPLECQSALHRRHRDSPLPPDVMSSAAERLRAIVEHADTVAPTDEVRRRAGRLVSVHPLRAADALQLAAALIWCEEQPHGEVFVCLDARLRDAAHREGFDVRP